jgi:acetyl esterase/lipase
MVVACLAIAGGGGACRSAPAATTTTTLTTEGPLSTTATISDRSFEVSRFEYHPGIAADLYLPVGGGALPVVMMVPGGAWLTADRSGLSPLAEYLAEKGMAVVNARVRAAVDGVTYPVPVEDVLCALATGIQQASASGRTPETVTVLGHSSGAHLAALAVLEPTIFHPECDAPLVTPDALVGLAGLYDVNDVSGLAVALFGVARQEAPEMWEEGNPISQAGAGPEVPVLLIHGDADPLVPVALTQQFAGALEAGGHAVRVEVLPGEDHHSVYSARAAGGLIADWTIHNQHEKEQEQ